MELQFHGDRTESHLGIDDNVVFSFGNIGMEGAVNHAAVFDDDGLEEILFPFFVPVLVFRFADGVGKGYTFQRKLGQHIVQGFLVEE